MKIIADMRDGKFLIEATTQEITHIIGDRWISDVDKNLTKEIPSNGYYRTETVFRVGAEFKVSPAYEWMARFKENRAAALKAAGVMRAFLDHVESTVPEIVPPIVISPEDVKAAEAQS